MLAEKSDGPPPRCALVGGVNTFSENGTNFVGRLLHEGGVWRRTFLVFSQYQNGQYGGVATNSAMTTVLTLSERRNILVCGGGVAAS
jgi:hypothetical protein